MHSLPSYFIRRKSEEMKKVKCGEQPPSGHSQPSGCGQLSYAQVVSPHGIKRTTSQREALSPIECCPKRTICSYPVERDAVELTPLNCSPDENSFKEKMPDYNTFCSTTGVQRRLFASPKTGQQTTRPTEGTRYKGA